MTPAEIIAFIVGSILVGGIIGGLGRLLVPRTARFGLLPTILVGAVAAFCGNVLGRAMHWSSLGTLVAQVLIAAAGVLLFRKPSAGRR